MMTVQTLPYSSSNFSVSSQSCSTFGCSTTTANATTAPPCSFHSILINGLCWISNCSAGQYRKEATCLNMTNTTCPIGEAFNSASAKDTTTFEGSTKDDGLCTSCVPGQYKPTPTPSFCLACPKGYYTNQSRASFCSACSTGFYSATIENTECDACNAGTYNNQTAATSISVCKTCAAGQFAVIGQVACKVCESGSITDTGTLTGATSCDQCAPGSYSTSSAVSICPTCNPIDHAVSVTCTIDVDAVVATCAAGYFGAVGDSMCQLCAAGSITDTGTLTGATSCDQCAPGSYSISSAVSTCLTCNPIDHAVSVTCTTDEDAVVATCAAGYFPTIVARDSCTACDIVNDRLSSSNFTCTKAGDSRISECTANTHFKIAGATAVGAETNDACAACGSLSGEVVGALPTAAYTCTSFLDTRVSACVGGTFKTTGGAGTKDTCRKCVAGSTSASGGGCVDCVAGKWVEAGPGTAAGCKDCGAGSSVEAGAGTNVDDCVDCVVGRISAAGASCVDCAAGKSAAVGAATNTCSVCAAGQISATGAACVECDVGKWVAADAASGSTLCSNCETGKSTTTSGKTTLADCVACVATNASCAACSSALATGCTNISSCFANALDSNQDPTDGCEDIVVPPPPPPQLSLCTAVAHPATFCDAGNGLIELANSTTCATDTCIKTNDQKTCCKPKVKPSNNTTGSSSKPQPTKQTSTPNIQGADFVAVVVAIVSLIVIIGIAAVLVKRQHKKRKHKERNKKNKRHQDSKQLRGNQSTFTKKTNVTKIVPANNPANRDVEHIVVIKQAAQPPLPPPTSTNLVQGNAAHEELAPTQIRQNLRSLEQRVDAMVCQAGLNDSLLRQQLAERHAKMQARMQQRNGIKMAQFKGKMKADVQHAMDAVFQHGQELQLPALLEAEINAMVLTASLGTALVQQELNTRRVAMVQRLERTLATRLAKVRAVCDDEKNKVEQLIGAQNQAATVQLLVGGGIVEDKESAHNDSDEQNQSLVQLERRVDRLMVVAGSDAQQVQEYLAARHAQMKLRLQQRNSIRRNRLAGKLDAESLYTKEELSQGRQVVLPSIPDLHIRTMVLMAHTSAQVVHNELTVRREKMLTRLEQRNQEKLHRKMLTCDQEKKQVDLLLEAGGGKLSQKLELAAEETDPEDSLTVWSEVATKISDAAAENAAAEKHALDEANTAAEARIAQEKANAAAQNAAALLAIEKQREQQHALEEANKAKEAVLMAQASVLQAAMDDTLNPKQFEKVQAALDMVLRNSVNGKERKKDMELVARAQALLAQLRRVWLLKNAVANLNQTTIAEIKSFKEPVVEIVVVMRSVFLLLGNSKKELKDWKAIRLWVGKTGKESLKRRIAQYVVPLNGVNDEDVLASKLVKKQLDTVHVERIAEVSVGAMVFYSWAVGVLDEMRGEGGVETFPS